MRLPKPMQAEMVLSFPGGVKVIRALVISHHNDQQTRKAIIYH